ncbi:MFS transporter [Alcaligenaceae bacterium CGII-47]|nr:MFS transporter [Alcaligenaceae bacterium CGII-47]
MRTARIRRPVRDVLLACVLILLLAQSLVGALSLSALNSLVANNTAERIELLTQQTATQIQTGVQLGKPLAQYFGLSTLLDDLHARVPDMLGASVVLFDGRVLASKGAEVGAGSLVRVLADHQSQAGRDSAISLRPSGAVQRTDANSVTVAVPVGQAGAERGALVLSVRATGVWHSVLLSNNLWVLLLTTLGAAGVLTVLLRYVIPIQELAAASRARFLVPLLILLVAQGVFASYTIHTFRDVWTRVAHDNIQILGEGLQDKLNRVLGYGFLPGTLQDVDRPMVRLAASFPMIAEVQLHNAQGQMIVRADAHGALPMPSWRTDQADSALSFALQADAGGPVLGQLVLIPDQALIAAGVRDRIMDAVTVATVAMVAAIELLLLLTLLMGRAFAVPVRTRSGELTGLDDQSDLGLVARPVMFGFLFALALPLSFLPIYARALLPGGDVGQASTELLIALPIAAEMGCGLLTALLAGRLTDRRGWQFPVLAGLVGSVFGNLACALVGSLPELIVARGLAGLGYGLTWMGLQGFIVTRSPPAYRGRNMATIVAGLFAGHLSGAAVGAMLMQQVGFQMVFIVGAGLLCLPALGVLTLMWPYRQRTAPRLTQAQPCAGLGSPEPAASRTGMALHRLLFTRDFGMLLLGSVVPFSIAQVGLLTYALPLYLDAQGVSTGSIGRILMLYGLCVIYLGPYMGRMADGSLYKKYWIALGGIVGSAGLFSLHFTGGVTGAASAVVLMALASCLAGGAQTSYMLARSNVQRYGAAGATSVMRAADKFGQMLGPLMVGGLFATMGMSQGLAITGAMYLLATLAFMWWAPRLEPIAAPA